MKFTNDIKVLRYKDKLYSLNDIADIYLECLNLNKEVLIFIEYIEGVSFPFTTLVIDIDELVEASIGENLYSFQCCPSDINYMKEEDIYILEEYLHNLANKRKRMSIIGKLLDI